MNKNVTMKGIKEQTKFCKQLMDRLTAEINNTEEEYGYIDNHFRMATDIIRIRRELNDLRKMLYPYDY